MQGHTVKGVRINVLDAPMWKEDELWYLSVRPEEQFQRDHWYYEELLAIEDELRDREKLDVLLVPA